MGRSKSRKGGEVTDEELASSIQNLENKLNAAQTSLNDLKQQLNVGVNPDVKPDMQDDMQPDMQDDIKPYMQDDMNSVMKPDMQDEIQKPWQNNKDIKFYDGNGGRVSLSFPRIIMLLDNNINRGNTKKDWSSIKDQLLEANTTDEVKNIIKTSGMNFSANSVGGTRKKRRCGKRRRTAKRC